MATIPSDITLRPETKQDAPFRFELYATTRREELEAWGWPEPMRQSFLQMQFKAQQGYRTMYPKAEYRIVERDGRSIGQLIINRAEDEFRLVDIALLPEERGAGLGTALIEELLREAQAAGRPVRLTVLKGHRAARLYHRLGFRKTGETEVHEELEWRGDF